MITTKKIIQFDKNMKLCESIVREFGKTSTYAEIEAYTKKVGLDLSEKKWRLIRRKLFGLQSLEP